MSDSCKDVDKFWFEMWETGYIPFHNENVNPLFARHIDWLLNGKNSARIFFPFCGKAVDMKWLADKGHVIVGVEGAELAVQQFFEECNVQFKVHENMSGGFKLFKSVNERINIYVGNYYNIAETGEGNFDAVWDRGAMEAIFPKERPKYVEVMMSLIKPGCRLLVEIAEREDDKGPPHHISVDDMKALFGDDCDINCIDREDPITKDEDFTGFKLYSVENVKIPT